MKKSIWRTAKTIEVIQIALIWIGLSAAEYAAVAILRHAPTASTYYYGALSLNVLLFGVMPLLGTKQIVYDIQEICLYDIFVQLIGLVLFNAGKSDAIYLNLAFVISTLKITRLLWELFAVNTPWPPFGLLTFLRRETNRSNSNVLQKWQIFVFFSLGIAIVSIGLIAKQFVFDGGVPLPEIIVLIITFGGAKKLIAALENQEAQQAETQKALGIAEGEAAAKAKSVAELTAKNAQIEQQALALAAQNTQLEALSAEREAMIQELAKRNATLRDASHDFKVPLLSLSGLVHQLQDQITVAAPAQLLTRLDQGLEELRSMMGDIIQQAKISTELTTPIARRLEVMELSNFFHERFHEMAGKRDVSFAVRADEFAVFANEMLLRRAITNLANNAILYAEPGTQVTLSFRRSGARCYVRIYDTGPGIANANGPDRHANFVNLIETIKERRQPITPDAATAQGHGLGLQIVQRLCQELGSEIGLQSILGFGTVFRFSIPLAD